MFRKQLASFFNIKLLNLTNEEVSININSRFQCLAKYNSRNLLSAIIVNCLKLEKYSKPIVLRPLKQL